MKMNFKFNLLAAAAAALVAISPVETFASTVLRGSVSDTSGAAVIGATVKVAAGDAERTILTDAAGRFFVEGIGPQARIEVTAPGFASYRTEVPDARKAVDIVLVPAARA